MSDDLTEQEIRRRLVIFLRIPAEVWTDVLKMLPRRTLVRNISPVCFRLKEISNRNVKTIHVIENVYRFNMKLHQNNPEANQQLEDLARNNCKLDSQFQLTRIQISQENKAILRHCIELFRGCQLSLLPKKDVTLINECLTRLEAAKPIAVYICLYYDPQLLFLRHPTVWNCNRVTLSKTFWYFDAMPMPVAVLFLDWLHHQPIGVDMESGDGAGQEEVRCLMIKGSFTQEAIDWLINRCVQNLQQSQCLEDRRRFVVSFIVLTSVETTGLDQFERQHNQLTGEVLLLENSVSADQITTVYRLRRSLAEEAANGNQFYGKTFKQDDPWDQFVVDDGPKVELIKWEEEWQ